MKKLIHILIGVISHLLITSFVLNPIGTGGIHGIVSDENGEAIPFANVIVLQSGRQITGTTTDFDGKFKIKALQPAQYNVRVSCVGFQAEEKQGVIVKGNQLTLVDFRLQSGVKLEEVQIVSYNIPMIEKDGTSKTTVTGSDLFPYRGAGGRGHTSYDSYPQVTPRRISNTSTTTVSGSDIQRLPSRGAAAAVTTVAGVQDNSGVIGSIQGTRDQSIDTFIDGVKVRGSAALPQAAMEQVRIVPSGVPAQYGDATGGVISFLGDMSIGAPGLSGIDSERSVSRKRRKLQPEGLTAGYDLYRQQSFKNVFAEPLSTFSIDVDAASYSQIRRSLNMGSLPAVEIVRIEEMINYFKYDYPQPLDDKPFSITTEVSSCPWNSANQLVHIGLQGKELDIKERPKNNLIFLIDVSGSMSSEDKLPLLKRSLRLLVNELEETDKISIVVYAGAAGLVLPSTSGDKKHQILDAIDRLSSGGSTAGGAGIELAYSIAEKEFIKKGNNRVILCTDGDFNVGVSSDEGLEKLIEKKRETGVFLTVLGFGTGNFQDKKMETLADKGNGNFAYIDNLQEAQKVLVQEFWGTLFTIAKDVKIQVEFNPANVLAYRLIGYENRRLAAEDFNDDRKDAGELGAGHTVTALYEVIPVGGELSSGLPLVDSLKYQLTKPSISTQHEEELLTVKLRYKKPDEDVSKLIVQPLLNKTVPLAESSDNMRFSAALSHFGMILLDRELKVTQRVGQIQEVIEMAEQSKGADDDGRRAEFVRLAELAMIVD